MRRGMHCLHVARGLCPGCDVVPRASLAHVALSLQELHATRLATARGHARHIAPRLLPPFQPGTPLQPPCHPPPLPAASPKGSSAPGGTLPGARRGRRALAPGGLSCGSRRHPPLPGQLGALCSCLLLLHPHKPSPSHSGGSAAGRAPSPKQGKRGAQPPLFPSLLGQAALGKALEPPQPK